MIEIMESVSPEAVAVSARGAITMEDYQKVSPLIFGKIAAFGKVPVLLTLKDIDAVASKDVWNGIRSDLRKHLNDFSRIAVVVDGIKFKMLVQMAKPFIPVDVKIFDEGREQDALKWVLE